MNQRLRLKKLPRRFYLRPTLLVAKHLLGKYLVRRIGNTRLIGKIVEVEAYREGDPASHSYRGKTKRNEVMFWKGGHLYVYFTYGMHFCANVVTGAQGKGEAVLIRAVEPIKRIDVMMSNRKRRTGEGERGRSGARVQQGDGVVMNLTNGPAKVCEAFGIGREQNGTDLLGDKIYILDARTLPRNRIIATPRIGIRIGREKLWRFVVKENLWVSKK